MFQSFSGFVDTYTAACYTTTNQSYRKTTKTGVIALRLVNMRDVGGYRDSPLGAHLGTDAAADTFARIDVSNAVFDADSAVRANFFTVAVA